MGSYTPQTPCAPRAAKHPLRVCSAPRSLKYPRRKEVPPIDFCHIPVSLIKRSEGRSAVAAAAYRSGTKLTNEWDGLTHDYTREDGNVDVYNMNGEIDETLNLSAESILIADGSSLIIAEYGETYRIYDKDGIELSDERYLDIESIENYWMLQNLDGEYGLMDNVGNMRIQFGDMGDESYNGKDWENTYIFNDTFCIITENGQGSSVWLF